MAERLPEAKAKSDIKKTGQVIVVYHSDSKCDSDHDSKSYKENWAFDHVSM